MRDYLVSKDFQNYVLRTWNVIHPDRIAKGVGVVPPEYYEVHAAYYEKEENGCGPWDSTYAHKEETIVPEDSIHTGDMVGYGPGSKYLYIFPEGGIAVARHAWRCRCVWGEFRFGDDSPCGIVIN